MPEVPGASAAEGRSLHVAHVAQPTTEGVARCVAGLSRHQLLHGCRVTVVSPTSGWLASEAVDAGADHVPWVATREPGAAVVGETLRLGRILARLQPDVVHLHSAKAGLAGRLALRGTVPTVYQPHAWSFLAVRGPLAGAALGWERWAVRWTRLVVCVSQSELAAGKLGGLALATKARVVPNGVDLDAFAPRDRTQARGRLGLANRPLAVCVGRLSEQKGQDMLLEAWRTVVEQVPDARLALVGDGPWRDRLVAAAGDAVTFAGNAQEPADWYAAADVVVVPSRWEGMALVPLEAGAAARSVVVTDVAGAREALPAGATGVVRPGDPGAIASAVAARLMDPAMADREGARARAHVQAHYELRVSGDRMLRAYRHALGATSSARPT